MPFRRRSDAIERLYRLYEESFAFLFIYVREAHPADGWALEHNERDGVSVDDPKSYEERVALASKTADRLGLSMPVLVDELDDAVENAYAAWPDRIFVVDRDRQVIYAGEHGPWGFKPHLAERVLRRHPASRHSG
jgi:hypothetical protein